MPLQSISLGYKQEKTRLVLELREAIISQWELQTPSSPVAGSGKPRLRLTERLVGCNIKNLLGGSRQQGQDYCLEKRRQETNKGDGGCTSVKDGRRVQQDQRCVIRPTRKLDNLGQGCQPENQLEDPTGKTQFPHQVDTLPCFRNLHQWFGNKECCLLCKAPVQAYSTSCQAARWHFSQGLCRRYHKQVLRKLAKVLEVRRQESSGSSSSVEHPIQYVKEGGVRKNTRSRETPKLFASDPEGTWESILAGSSSAPVRLQSRHASGSWVQGGWLENHHVPNGNWMQRLCGAVNHTPAEGRRSDGRRGGEGQKAKMLSRLHQLPVYLQLPPSSRTNL